MQSRRGRVRRPPPPPIQIGFCGLTHPFALAIYRWRFAIVPECVWRRLPRYWLYVFVAAAIVFMAVQLGFAVYIFQQYSLLPPSSPYFRNFMFIYVSAFLMPFFLICFALFVIYLDTSTSFIIGTDYLMLIVVLHAVLELIAVTDYRPVPIPSPKMDRTIWVDDSLDHFAGEFANEASPPDSGVRFPDGNYEFHFFVLISELALSLVMWIAVSYGSVYRQF